MKLTRGRETMNRYDKAFEGEAVRLSEEIGSKKATVQLGVCPRTVFQLKI